MTPHALIIVTKDAIVLAIIEMHIVSTLPHTDAARYATFLVPLDDKIWFVQ
jgi:hypothetical protein